MGFYWVNFNQWECGKGSHKPITDLERGIALIPCWSSLVVLWEGGCHRVGRGELRDPTKYQHYTYTLKYELKADPRMYELGGKILNLQSMLLSSCQNQKVIFIVIWFPWRSNYKFFTKIKYSKYRICINMFFHINKNSLLLFIKDKSRDNMKGLEKT